MTIQRMDHVGAVVDDIDATVASVRARGPEGIIVALAEQLS